MRQDLLHDSFLGVGVILNVRPFLRGEPALFCGVAFAVSGMAAQMVAEGQHALCFVAALTEHVEIDSGRLAFEHAVLIPIRFAHAQRVTSCFERWRVALFARGVIDEQEDIDDRLGAEPRHRGGADMFNAHRLSREGASDLDVFLRVKRGPVWIIIAEDDCVFWVSGAPMVTVLR